MRNILIIIMLVVGIFSWNVYGIQFSQEDIEKYKRETADEIIKGSELDKYPPETPLDVAPHRYLCAIALGYTKDIKAVDFLLNMLSNEKEDGQVRVMAMASLAKLNKAGLIKDKRYIEELKRLAKKKGNGKTDMRADAARALYYLGEKEIAYKVVDELAKNEGQFAYPGVEEILVNEELQALFIKALDYEDDQIVVKVVEKLLCLKDYNIRKKAYKAYLRIKGHKRDLRKPRDKSIENELKGIENRRIKKEDKE